jgi:hypothetical protein
VLSAIFTTALSDRIDVGSAVVTVARTVWELRPQFHPTGGRFLIRMYPKNREYRRLSIRRVLADRLVAFIHTERLKVRTSLRQHQQLRQECSRARSQAARGQAVLPQHSQAGGGSAGYTAARVLMGWFACSPPDSIVVERNGRHERRGRTDEHSRQGSPRSGIAAGDRTVRHDGGVRNRWGTGVGRSREHRA